MKKQLIFYGLIIVTFIIYNQFFQVEDAKTNTIINILFASFIFLYIGYLAFLVLHRLKKTRKK